jgi:hypothetical protein
MPTQPPPSRYRVIERGRRLEVIDTWATTRPPRLEPRPEPADRYDDIPVSAPAPASAVVADAWPTTPGFTVTPVPDDSPPVAREPAAALPPRASRAFSNEPDLLRNIAVMVCGGKRDGDGALLLTTARFYDRRAPRTITLDVEGEREVGLIVVMGLVILIAATLTALSFGGPGIFVLLIALSLLRQTKMATTPWLDRLEGLP